MKKIQMDNLDNVNGGFSLFDRWKKKSPVENTIVENSSTQNSYTKEDVLKTVERATNMRDQAMKLYGLAPDSQTKAGFQEVISRCDRALAGCDEILRGMK